MADQAFRNFVAIFASKPSFFAPWDSVVRAGQVFSASVRLAPVRYAFCADCFRPKFTVVKKELVLPCVYAIELTSPQFSETRVALRSQ